jgi:RHS repeat-associated protein
VVSTLTANTLRFIDEGLTRHTDYWYRLTASNGQGGSEVHTLRTQTAFDPVIYPASGPTEDLVIDYGYDPLDRLTTADYNDESYYHYSYDAVGNRLSETTPAGTTNYVYDDANRLSSVGGVSYSWDDNGNLTGDGVNTYSYDDANRLIGIVRASLTASYTYNGLGDRVGQVENGTTASFVLDLTVGLTQVLQDSTHTYLYGNERIGQFTTGTAEYFLGDALGSVRQLIDGDGVVGVVKRYEPYGALVSSMGESSSAFGFTGEWASSNSNLLYLRSRYYSSEMGRFLTRDSWQGNYIRPLSLNRWNYVEGNPINWNDPTGYCRGSDCFDSTPIPPKQPTQEPTLQPVPVPPGMPVPSVPEISRTSEIEGYLIGSYSTLTTPWLVISEGLRRIEKEKLGKYGCHNPVRLSGVITGEETVYDFVHLQKAKFKYRGITAVPLSLVQWENAAYEGMMWGFGNFYDVTGYRGFSMSISGEIHAFDFFGAGVAINLPMDDHGRNVIATGVSSLTWSVNFGIGFGINSATIGEGSVVISYYEVDGAITDFYHLNNNNRIHAALAMMKDMNKTVSPIKTPGLDLAIQALYHRITGESLYKR